MSDEEAKGKVIRDAVVTFSVYQGDSGVGWFAYAHLGGSAGTVSGSGNSLYDAARELQDDYEWTLKEAGDE